MKPEIENQMRNFGAEQGHRVDSVAQALRRLYLRTELCPCQFDARWEQAGCLQCQMDKQSIEEAWEYSQSAV
jgi:hypothetical protein